MAQPGFKIEYLFLAFDQEIEMLIRRLLNDLNLQYFIREKFKKRLDEISKEERAKYIDIFLEEKKLKYDANISIKFRKKLGKRNINKSSSLPGSSEDIEHLKYLWGLVNYEDYLKREKRLKIPLSNLRCVDREEGIFEVEKLVNGKNSG